MLGGINKRKLRRKEKEEEKESKMNEEEQPFSSPEVGKEAANENKNLNSFSMPEFLKSAENEQYIQTYIRMRQRHSADGAISLNLEEDDMADQNVELYEDKGINLDVPQLNDKLADNVDYYVESVSRDKFFKVSKSALEGMRKREQAKVEGERQPVSRPKAGKFTKEMTPVEIVKATEEETFREFDDKLTQIIIKTINKISLIFLFTQGILAGTLSLTFK